MIIYFPIFNSISNMIYAADDCLSDKGNLDKFIFLSVITGCLFHFTLSCRWFITIFSIWQVCPFGKRNRVILCNHLDVLAIQAFCSIEYPTSYYRSNNSVSFRLIERVNLWARLHVVFNETGFIFVLSDKSG